MSTHAADSERRKSDSQHRSDDSAAKQRQRERSHNADATGERDADRATRDDTFPNRSAARSEFTEAAEPTGDGGGRRRRGATRLQRTRGNRAVARAADAARDRRDRGTSRGSEAGVTESGASSIAREAAGTRSEPAANETAGSVGTTSETAPSRPSADRDRTEQLSGFTPLEARGQTAEQPALREPLPTDARSRERLAGVTGSVTGDQTDSGGVSESAGAASPAAEPTSRRDAVSRLRSTGPGRPLPGGLRETMESRFDHDFGEVRVHTTAAAAAAVAAVDAKALTYGTDIYFGPGRYRPGTSAGRELLAHELTHVVQQARSGTAAVAGSIPAISRPGDPTEREARGAARLVEAGTPVAVRESPGEPTIYRNAVGDFFSNVGGAVSSAASSAYEAGKGAVQEGAEFAGETAREVGEAASGAVRRSAEFVEESMEEVSEVGRALVQRIAPGLIEFLENPAGRIRDVLCSGLDSFLSGALGLLDETDFDVVSNLGSLFQRLIAGVQGVREQLSKGISATLGTLLGPLVTAIEDEGLPALQEVQEVITTVQGAFQSVLESVGKPVAGFLEEVGGAVWQGITDLADWVWDLTAPLRQYAQRAWDWVVSTFDIAWESSEGARNWLVEQASSVWESLQSTIEPVLGPLKTVGGILAVLSPFGPVIVLSKVIVPLWEKLKWIWNNWNTDDILIRARETLQKQILPAVLGGIADVSNALGRAATWLRKQITQLESAIAPMLGALGVSKCIQSVTRVIRFVGNQFTALAEWARSDFTGLMQTVRSTLNTLAGLLEPVLDFLVVLGQAVVNPLRIPLAIGGALWQLIPESLKPPIVTFLFELLVTFVKSIPAFATVLGPFGTIVKQAVLGFLTRLRDAAKQVKTDVSNRIADLLSGSFEFASGFLWGMLRGIWEGLTDPFVIIAMLVQVAVRASRYLVDGIRQLTGSSGTESESVTDGSAVAGGARGAEDVGGGPGAEQIGGEGGLSERSPTERPAIAREKRALEATASDTKGLDGEYTAAREQASSQQHATTDGLFSMLSSVWGQVIAKSQSIGASIATALLDFFRLPDFELGDKLGWVGGTVLFEVVLAILTGPAFRALRASKPVLRGILRLLDLGGEILGALGRLLGKIRRPVMSGLEAIGGFVRKIPGLGRVFDTLQDALRTLFRSADEAAAAGRGAREPAEAQTERVGRETVETAGGGARRADVEDLPTAPTRVGDHEVKFTPGGDLVRCSEVCELIRTQYASELRRNRELALRWFELRDKARRIQDPNSQAAQEVLEEARDLTDALEVVRRSEEVRLYRGVAVEEIPTEFRMDERLVMDMEFVGRIAPGYKRNAAGWKRNNIEYWEEMVRRHPEAFDSSNLWKIEHGLSPKNNPTFRSVFSQYDDPKWYNDTLIHHHIGRGGQAAAIPASLHPGTGGVHLAEDVRGITGSEDEVADVLERLLSKTGGND